MEKFKTRKKSSEISEPLVSCLVHGPLARHFKCSLAAHPKYYTVLHTVYLGLKFKSSICINHLINDVSFLDCFVRANVTFILVTEIN